MRYEHFVNLLILLSAVSTFIVIGEVQCTSIFISKANRDFADIRLTINSQLNNRSISYRLTDFQRLTDLGQNKSSEGSHNETFNDTTRADGSKSRLPGGKAELFFKKIRSKPFLPRGKTYAKQILLTNSQELSAARESSSSNLQKSRKFRRDLLNKPPEENVNALPCQLKSCSAASKLFFDLATDVFTDKFGLSSSKQLMCEMVTFFYLRITFFFSVKFYNLLFYNFFFFNFNFIIFSYYFFLCIFRILSYD